LSHPRPGRLRGDPEQPHPPGGELHDEEQIEAAEEHRVDVGEVAGQDRLGLGREELAPRLPGPGGAGPTPARRRMSHTVEGASRWPSPTSSPWILRYPQPGLSAASRNTNSRIVGRVGGRPGRRRAVQRRRIRSRCQRSTVSGVTNSRGQWPRGTSWLSAAWTARSAQESRGLATCRRSTASWWRSTRISAFFDARLRPTRPNKPTAVRRIR
jgi:hypothetical protein